MLHFLSILVKSGCSIRFISPTVRWSGSRSCLSHSTRNVRPRRWCFCCLVQNGTMRRSNGIFSSKRVNRSGFVLFCDPHYGKIEYEHFMARTILLIAVSIKVQWIVCTYIYIHDLHWSSFYYFRFEISFTEKYYAFPVNYVGNNKWFHVVVNYRANELRMEAYIDKIIKISTTNSDTYSFSPGNGVLQIGRRYTDRNNYYNSMWADDLLFFNTSLTQSDITAIYDMY